MSRPDDPAVRARRGIQSIEVGARLLHALVNHGAPMALKDLARGAGMAAAKAHPYLVSFGRAGLIEQEVGSGLYFLGPLALQLGRISLQQTDPVHVATPLAAALAQRLGLTVALAVWGSRGATIVRVEQSPAPVHVAMRHGTVFSLAHTASGRLFGAYLAAPEVKAMFDAERRRASTAAAPGAPLARPMPSWRAFEAELAQVRAHGVSRSEGEVVTGINAMAAPVVDHGGAIVLALTAIGPAGLFDIGWNSPVASALREAAAAASERLGAGSA